MHSLICTKSCKLLTFAFISSVADDDQATVHGVITSDGLFDGTIHTRLEDYYIEPLSRYLGHNVTSEVHSIIYRGSDTIKPFRESCASAELAKKIRDNAANSIETSEEENFHWHEKITHSEEESDRNKKPFKSRTLRSIEEEKSEDAFSNSEPLSRVKRWFPEESLLDSSPPRNDSKPNTRHIIVNSPNTVYHFGANRTNSNSNSNTKVHEEIVRDSLDSIRIIKVPGDVSILTRAKGNDSIIPHFPKSNHYNPPVDRSHYPKIIVGTGSSDDSNAIFDPDDLLARQQHIHKRATIDPKKTTCMLYLQADHLFFQRYGTEEACIEVMTRHVQRVNTIYRITGEFLLLL